MKKHTHINTIPTSETANSFEWEVVDRKPNIDIEVENANVIQGSFLKETLAPTLLIILQKLWSGLRTICSAAFYQIRKKVSNTNFDFQFAQQLQTKNIPWVKVGLVVFAGYVLMTKNMSFNFNLSAPFIAVADDDNEHENHAKAVANPYAPVSSKALSKREVEVFIKRYAPIAKKEMELYGIPASIKIGQALIESRAGTSRLAVNNNNFFGMKCFSKKCGKGHCSNATDDSHKDFFRKYKSVGESFRAHSELLSGKRYRDLKKHKSDYKSWAKGLKRNGYATDRTYDKKLINVIEKYKLHKLDG